MGKLTEADRWRLTSALLAAVCIVLALQLWTVGSRLQHTTAQVRSSLAGCPLSLDDLEHS